MDLTVHTPEDAPGGARPVLQGIADDLGFVPNMAGAVANSPVLLAGFDGLRRAVGSGGLDPVLREVAGLAVGVAVDNAYGVAFHSTVLGSLGVDEADIAAMRAGEPGDDASRAAVYELARRVVLDRGKVDDDVVTRATTAGLSTEDVLEVVAECVFASLVGVVDNLAGRVELDAFLSPRAWAGPARV
ncbi:MAG TPA: carboxymuconolactone decarboxylase family protein [Acidimicrobiales bacterium]|nr:carboxymuconolactone decarboxylase family protein [Acidimicrobiales bacterium]